MGLLVDIEIFILKIGSRGCYLFILNLYYWFCRVGGGYIFKGGNILLLMRVSRNMYRI